MNDPVKSSSTDGPGGEMPAIGSESDHVVDPEASTKSLVDQEDSTEENPFASEQLCTTLPLAPVLQHPKRRHLGPAIPVGATIADGRYRIVELIGSGGFGAVYRAEDTELGRFVALKVLHRAMNGDEHQRFQNECRALARLDHPGIVAVFDAGQSEYGPYFLSKLIDGPDVGLHLKSDPGYWRESPMRGAQLVHDVADAVQCAHDHKVIHRDIKPSNILIAPGGTPQLADFGLAKLPGLDQTLTQEGAVMGTAPYMSPEQARGAIGEVDQQSDIYSLGATLYHVVTGELPFRGNVAAILMQVQEVEPQRPSLLNPLVSADLEAIVLRALEKDRSERYESAAEMKGDLARVLEGRELSRRTQRLRDIRYSWRGRAWKWSRRNPLAAGFLTAFLVASVAGVMGVTWQWRESVAARDDAIEGWRQSEQNLRLAQGAIDEVTDLLKADPYLNRVESRPARRRLLEVTSRYYLEFLRRDYQQLDLEDDQAWARLQLLELDDETADANPTSQQSSTGADQRFRQLLPANHGDIEARIEHVWALMSAAERSTGTGNVEAGLDSFALCVELSQYLAESDQDRAECQALLAEAHLGLGRAFRDHNRLEDGIQHLQAAANQYASMWQKFAATSFRPRRIGAAFDELGIAYQQAGDFDRALQAYETALKLRRDIAASYTDHEYNRYDLCVSHINLGRFHYGKGRLNDSVRELQQGLAIGRDLVREFPRIVDYESVMSTTLVNLAKALRDLGRFADSEAAYSEALPMMESLAANENLHYATGVARICEGMGKLKRLEGEYDASIEWYARAERELNDVLKRSPSDARALRYLIELLSGRMETYAQQSNYRAALSDVDQLLRISGARELDGAIAVLDRAADSGFMKDESNRRWLLNPAQLPSLHEHARTSTKIKAVLSDQ